MAIFRKVHTEFWTDPKVLEEMTPEDKYFMLYLLTNSNTTQIGIYQISKKTIAFELGYSPESINALMDRFINNHKLIKYNDETRELAIKNWGRYNLDRAGKPMEDCVKSELSRVKDEDLIAYVGEFVKSAKLKALYDTYTIRHTSSGQEEEEEEEEEEEDKEEDKEEQQKEGEENNSRSSSEIKKTSNKYKDLEIDENLKLIAKEYEQCGFGTIDGRTKELLEDLLEQFSTEWIVQAFIKCVEANKRTISYAKGILNNWKTEGGMKLGGKKDGEGSGGSNSKAEEEYGDIKGVTYL